MRPPPRTSWRSPRPTWWWRTAAATTTSSTRSPTTRARPQEHHHRRGRVRPGRRKQAPQPRQRHADCRRGHAHGHGGFNEHVWYSLPAMAQAGRRRRRQAGRAGPGSAQDLHGQRGGLQSPDWTSCRRSRRHWPQPPTGKPWPSPSRCRCTCSRPPGLENKTPGGLHGGDRGRQPTSRRRAQGRRQIWSDPGASGCWPTTTRPRDRRRSA